MCDNILIRMISVYKIFKRTKSQLFS